MGITEVKTCLTNTCTEVTNAKNEAQISKEDAQAAQAAAESAAAQASSDASSAQTANTEAQAAQADAQISKVAAQTAQTAAESARDDAQTSATQAVEAAQEAEAAFDRVAQVETSMIKEPFIALPGYNAIGDISAVLSGDETFNETTKTFFVPTGTTDVVNTRTVVDFSNTIPEIHNAAENGIKDFEINFSCNSTIPFTCISAVQSNMQNTVETVNNIESGTNHTISFSLSSGEELTALYFYLRFGVGTADQDLTLEYNYAFLSSSNENVNTRLRRLFLNKKIDNDFSINSALINKNQYQVSHFVTENTVGLKKTYRGFEIKAGTVLDKNKVYLGRALNNNFEYLNGYNFTTKLMVKIEGGLTASELFYDIWEHEGGNMYSYSKSITDFNTGNASHLFSVQWNRAVTPENDIKVTVTDMYIESFGEELYDIIIAQQSKIANNPTEIYCSPSTQGTYGEVYNNLVVAMHSLTDGGENNVYNIILDGGEYDITTMLDLDNISNDPYRRGLELAPYVNMYGEYNTILNCRFTEAYAKDNPDITASISPLNFLGNNKLKNITAYAENCRYVIHDDGNSEKDCYAEIEDCYFEHLGNAPGVFWTASKAYGAGYPSGKTGIFKNTKLISRDTIPISCHTSNSSYKPFKLEFYGCELLSKTTNTPSLEMIQVSTHDPKMINTFELHGCTLNGSIQADNTTNSDCFNLVGGGNTTVPIVTKSGIRQVNLLADQGVRKITSEALSLMQATASDDMSTVRAFTTDDNIDVFAGFAQTDAVAGDLVPIQYGGYILDSDIGLSLSKGDTVALDNGVLVKNGTNTIGVCHYDNYLFLGK